MTTLHEFRLADAVASPDHIRQMEYALLAAMIQDPAVYHEVSSLVDEHVWLERETYKAVVKALLEGMEPPPIPVTPTDNPVETAQQLVDLFKRREVVEKLEYMLPRAADTNIPIDQVIQETEASLSSIQQVVAESSPQTSVAMTELFDRILQQSEKNYELRKRGELMGLPTSFPTLDKQLCGLQRGIHLFAAEPGMGKTTFTLQIARSTAQAGYPVIFVSFEEDIEKLTLKALCTLARAPLERFLNGYASPEEVQKLIREHGHKLHNIFLIPGLKKTSVNMVKAQALRRMHQLGKDRCLIIIDYLQYWAGAIDLELLLDSETERRNMRDFRFIVSKLSSQLRALANSLNSPVLLISSQNRTGQGSKSLTSLKESGELEYGGDSVWFLTDQEGYKEENAQNDIRHVVLSVRKNRYGRLGDIPLQFHAHKAYFEEEGQ